MIASALLLLQLAGSQDAKTERDDYGVPKITASSWESGFRAFGAAVAQDRLWQMELSRRLSRGRMAELSSENRRSDESTLKQAYTDEEMMEQFAALPKDVRVAYESYSQGVNDTIQERSKSGTLPGGYAKAGITPELWTALDSVAISINLIRRFGTGGAGELRSLALLEWLKTQPVKGKELDVLDDLSWFDDPKAPVTLKPQDDKHRNRPIIFHRPTRAETTAHLAQMPKSSLLELAGAVALTTNEPQQLLASNVAVANSWGSYAVAVSAKRSKTGRAFLLGGPQMGHSNPSVIHEAALDFAGLKVQGMNVPGIPMIAAGSTPNHAWTVTTGAADIEDIYASNLDSPDTYQYGTEKRAIQKVVFKRKDREGKEFIVTQERTHHGPVVLRSGSGKAVFSKRSVLWKSELTGVLAIFRLARSTDVNPIEESAKDGSPCFNVFIANTKGQIAWRFTGKMPLRPKGLDPRFPTPSKPENEWTGFVPYDQMPHVFEPSTGLLVNWNNKPVQSWPNGDTPVWGRFFRSRILEAALPKSALGRSDLERAIWTIARNDASSPTELAKFWQTDSPRLKPELGGIDGWALDGSLPALVHRAAVSNLRTQLFAPWVGNLTSPQLFARAIQPESIWAAIQGKTKFNYLKGKSQKEVIAAALAKTEEQLWAPENSLFRRGFVPGVINVPGQSPIPYLDRGTYIQITEMTEPPLARSVASPGVQEEGPHSQDQTSLARAWLYKSCWPFK